MKFDTTKYNRDHHDMLSAVSFRPTLILITGLLFGHEVSGYGNGANPPACRELMQPQHGAEPQRSAGPYKIALDKSEVKGGGQVGMTISGSKEFKGFLILVRKQGDPGKVFGEWKDGGDGFTHTVNCGEAGVTGFGATQKDPSLKTSVKVLWVAPNENAEYGVFFTVVQEEKIFWSQQQTKGHSKIKVSSAPFPSSVLSLIASIAAIIILIF